VLDGLYITRSDRPPRFQRLRAPGREELEDLIQKISHRVGRCLQRQGLLEQDAENAWLDLDPAEDTDAMPQIHGSSITYRVAVGPQQGRKAFMIRTLRPLRRQRPGHCLYQRAGCHRPDSGPPTTQGTAAPHPAGTGTADTGSAGDTGAFSGQGTHPDPSHTPRAQLNHVRAGTAVCPQAALAGIDEKGGDFVTMSVGDVGQIAASVPISGSRK